MYICMYKKPKEKSWAAGPIQKKKDLSRQLLLSNRKCEEIGCPRLCVYFFYFRGKENCPSTRPSNCHIWTMKRMKGKWRNDGINNRRVVSCSMRTMERVGIKKEAVMFSRTKRSSFVGRRLGSCFSPGGRRDVLAWSCSQASLIKRLRRVEPKRLFFEPPLESIGKWGDVVSKARKMKVCGGFDRQALSFRAQNGEMSSFLWRTVHVCV